MKKRKELDALVANGKCGKRAKKASGSCSAHELLKHDTDSSDVEEFSTVSSRKCRKKSSHIPLTSICVPLCQFVLVTMCILISGTLIWLHIGLREDLDILRAHIQQVEAGNKNTPELIHSLHNDLQNLEANVTALFVEIKKNIADVNNATNEIEKLKSVTSKLQASVDAAPALKQLPKNVESLSESVVTFGSKISALESSMKEMKDYQSSIQSSTRDIYGELDSIKATVHDLVNSTKSNANDSRLPFPPLARDLSYQSAIDETKRRVSNMENDLQELLGTVNTLKLSLVNSSKGFTDLSGKVEAVNDGLLWVMNDTHAINSKISSLENYTFYNLSARVDHFEVEGCKCDSSYLNVSEVLNLVNKTVTEAIGKETVHLQPAVSADGEELADERALHSQSVSDDGLMHSSTENTLDALSYVLNGTGHNLTKGVEPSEVASIKSTSTLLPTEMTDKGVIQPTTAISNHDTVSSYVTSIPSSPTNNQNDSSAVDSH